MDLKNLHCEASSGKASALAHMVVGDSRSISNNHPTFLSKFFLPHTSLNLPNPTFIFDTIPESNLSTIFLNPLQQLQVRSATATLSKDPAMFVCCSYIDSNMSKTTTPCSCSPVMYYKRCFRVLKISYILRSVSVPSVGVRA